MSTNQQITSASYKALLSDKIAAQGDIVILWRTGSPPEDMEPTEVQNSLVVAHSETGHHHVAHPMGGFVPPAGLLAKMIGDKAKTETHTFFRGAEGERITTVVNTVPVSIEHRRDFFTHGSIDLPPIQEMGENGYWEVRRQEVPKPGGGRQLNQD